MKKTMNSLFLVLSMMAGIIMVSGCSNHDDTNTSPNQEEEVTKGPLETAVITLNNDMSDLDFVELEPLENAVKAESTYNSSTRATNDVGDLFNEFQQKLLSLLDLLKGDISVQLSYGVRFNYQSFNDVLDMAWEVSGTLQAGRESDTNFLGKHSNIKGDAVYTANDGTVYTISAEFDKDVNIRNWSYTVAGARQLTIYKGEELLLSIITDNESNRPLYNPFKVRESMAGQITYRDYYITLTYQRPHTSERNAEITYSKANSNKPLIVLTTQVTDDANIWKTITHNVTYEAEFISKAMDNLLILKGKVNNVNYLVVEGIELSKCMKEGTTQERCNSLANDFNENLTLELYLEELKVGDIYMGTQYDSATALFKPTIMLKAEILGGGEYDLITLLASMGVSVSDIMSIGKLIE
ncbi:MAG: hypothetical protein II886_14435 [Prevotella sp.]|nr:hypothetical protein [Prevotella sp.]